MITKTTWLIFLVTYLVALAFFLAGIGASFGTSTVQYTTMQETFGMSGIGLDIVTGISILPIPVNVILVLIPIIFVTYIIFTNSIPTTNAGS